MAAFKVVLASTKNASQRIYLDGGVYAEATLMSHDGGFQEWPYTYPDYLWPETLDFLTRLRAVYLEQLRAHLNQFGIDSAQLLRRDLGVGWVESFGVAQDRLRDTHHSGRRVSALCASTHPTISLEAHLLR